MNRLGAVFIIAAFLSESSECQSMAWAHMEVYDLVISGDRIIAATSEGVELYSRRADSWVMARGNLTACTFDLLRGPAGLLAGTWDGIYSTRDNGLTWHRTSLKDTIIFTLMQYNDSTILAGTSEGVLLSTDNGATWNLTSLKTSVLQLAKSGGFVMAAGVGTIFGTSDRGKQWIPINIPYPLLWSRSLVGTSDGFLYSSPGRVARSVDRGAHWEPMDTMSSVSMLSTLEDGTVIIIGGQEGALRRSIDFGTTWSKPVTILRWMGCTAFTTRDSVFVAAPGNGSILISHDNGNRWSPVTPGVADQNVVGIHPSAGVSYAVTMSLGLFRSADEGKTWSQVPQSLSIQNMSALETNGDTLYVGTFAGKLWRSDDEGESWEPMSAGLPEGPIIDVKSFGSRLVAAIWEKGVYEWNNEQKKWAMLFEAHSREESPTSLAFEETPDGTIMYVGTFGGGVLRRFPGESQWITNNEGIEDGKVTSLAGVVPRGQASFLLAGTTRGVFRSRDRGSTWQRCYSSETALPPVTTLASGQAIVVGGTNAGAIVVSTDMGNSWTTFSVADSLAISVFKVSILGNRLLVATIGGGVRAYDLIVEQSQPRLIPTAFALEQNYPNPFNAGTSIRFDLPVAGDVRIDIFDIQGRLIDTPVNAAFLPSRHVVRWDGSRSASGVYFYRMMSGSFSSTRKMILIK